MATRKFVRSFEPFPDATTLGPIVETSPGKLLGLWIVNPNTHGKEATCFYRFDLFHGHSFHMGPDGWVWTYYKLPYADSPGLLSRINPDDLRLHGIGTVEASNRFLFVGRDIYLTGAGTLRRIKGIVPGD